MDEDDSQEYDPLPMQYLTGQRYVVDGPRSLSKRLKEGSEPYIKAKKALVDRLLEGKANNRIQSALGFMFLDDDDPLLKERIGDGPIDPDHHLHERKLTISYRRKGNRSDPLGDTTVIILLMLAHDKLGSVEKACFEVSEQLGVDDQTCKKIWARNKAIRTLLKKTLPDDWFEDSPQNS